MKINKKVKNENIAREIEVAEQDMADVLLDIISKSPGFDKQGLKALAKAYRMEDDIFEIALKALKKNKLIYKDVENGICPEED